MLGHTLKVDTMRHNETILKSESSARRPPRCPRSAQTFYARIKRSPLRSSSGLCRGSSSALILDVWIYVGQTSYSNNLPFPKFLSIFCPHLKSWKCPQSRNHQYCGQVICIYTPTPKLSWTNGQCKVLHSSVWAGDILQAPSCCWDWRLWNVRTRARFIFVLFIHSHQHQQLRYSVQSSVILLVRQQYLLVISSGWEK